MSDTSCWCGSGKPWVDCHKGRSAQPRIPRHKIHDRLKAIRGRRGCLHFEAPNACSRSFILARSVQKRALKQIARDGKVYQFTGEFGTLVKTGGRVAAGLVGVHRATVFGGFCDRHDNDLFKPIDASPLNVDELTAALHFYRAVCREVWVRENAHFTMPFYRTVDRGRSEEEQRRLQHFLAEYEAALSGGTDAIRATKRTLDDTRRA